MVLMAREENGTQAIDRAARILEHLVERDDFVTLSSVVEGTQLPKSTAARLLRALERNGLAQRGVAGGFRPGPLLVDYARRDTSTADLGALARPFLERLGARTGETTNIAIPTPGRRRPPGRDPEPAPARRRHLGRQPHPRARVRARQGLHGVRGRAAAVRPARAPRARHHHDHRRAAARGRGRPRARLGLDLGGARGRALLGRRPRPRQPRRDRRHLRLDAHGARHARRPANAWRRSSWRRPTPCPPTSAAGPQSTRRRTR